ncbi:hypothetical protein ACF0H5_008746 [Mactra antiquata]
MAWNYINCLLFFLWIIQKEAVEAATTSAPTSTTSSTTTSGVTTVAPSSTNLSCYDCSESFKYVWEPYTTCQYYPMNTPLRPCLDVERYCKIERVTYKSVTVSITRGCTKECWHGCYASGFGLTKLKCTSCCLTPGCNVGDTAAYLHNRHVDIIVMATGMIFLMRAIVL